MTAACGERPFVAGHRRDDGPVLLHPTSYPRASTLHVHAPDAPVSLTDLLAADSPDARHRIIARLLRETGYEWLAYGILERAGDGLRPVSLCTAHAHVDWVRRYCAQAYHEVDPRLAEAAASSLPRTWTLESLHERSLKTPPASALRHFVADLGDTGMRSGVVFMLPGETERRRHFMSLMTHVPGERTMEGAPLGRVLTLGLCLNEYYTRLNTPPGIPARSLDLLSAVQREILRLLGRGESDKRIAHLLRISSHTVDYHMRKLRSRFAVHNRVQLAQISRTFLD